MEPVEQFFQGVGLLPFAVLSNTTDPTGTLNRVAQAIDDIQQPQQQRNLAGCAAILAGLRLNHDVIRRNATGEGMDVEHVARLTGLSVEQVQELQHSLE
ncbi:MAG: hypothetical protein ACHBN1_09700 [Heteroscytonema crispum UTEX LB 1556]